MRADLALARLRRALAARGIDPAAPLDDALPRRGRADLWEALEADLDLRLPRLRTPGWLLALGAAAAVGVAVGFGPLAGLLAGALAWAAVASFAVELPEGCRDARGLADRVALSNFRRG
jgi:hypothetical protein